MVVSRGLRFLRDNLLAFSSWVRLLGFRLLCPGLKVGKGVRLGRGVRLKAVKGATLKIGDDTVIEPYCELDSHGRLVIGRNGYIGMSSVIVAAESISIGDDALIASHCAIRDQDHGTGGIPYRSQPQVTSPIVLGNNVWLGAGVAVLKGVTIGDHCVVGAGAVVTKSLREGTRASGVPARPR